METQPISFGNNGGGKGSVFGALKSSAVNVGVTAAAGITAGGIAGKVVSLVPRTPSEVAMKFQYGDMFTKAALREDLPQYLQGKSADLLDLITNGRKINSEFINLQKTAQEAATLHNQVVKASAEVIAGDEFKTKIAEFFKATPDVIPEGGFTKETLLEKLSSMYTDAGKGIVSKGEAFQGLKKDFADKAAQLKDVDMTALAEKGAKHLRATSIIGVGMAIGLVAALVLNILKTHGAFNKAKKSAAGENMYNTQLRTHQG